MRRLILQWSAMRMVIGPYFFEGYPKHPGTIYEVELKFDIANRQKTLEPLKAITWKDDVINDVQLVTIKTKYL